MAAAPALAQLQRLLYLIPVAARDGGVALRDLADQLDVSEQQILRDLSKLLTRAYYHPAGSGSQLQVELQAGRVRIWSSGAFKRPPALTAREALALAVGLRMTDGNEDRDPHAVASAAEGGPWEPTGGKRRPLKMLLERLTGALASRVLGEELRATAGPPLDGDRALQYRCLTEAARDRRKCRFTYLSGGSEPPRNRIVHPYVIIHAEGETYIVGHCELSGEVRVFRRDRIVVCEILETTFHVPEWFDANDYVTDGRVFNATAGQRTRVRYGPAIARWISERTAGSLEPDGSFVVEHEVADPDWMVRHILQYGGEAEVIEPAHLRAWVHASAKAVAV